MIEIISIYFPTTEMSPFYVNLHPIESEQKWVEEVVERREQLVNVKDFYSQYVGPPPTVEAIRQHRISAERRRSRSTSDLNKDLEDLQENYHKKHHPLFEEPIDLSSSDEENKPPLPARTNSRPKPIPRQRKTGLPRPPSNLDTPVRSPSGLDAHVVAPSPTLDGHGFNQPNSPALQSPVIKHFFQEHDPHRERKVSEPIQHTYINTSNIAQPVSSPRLPRRGPSLDVSRRPLPCPHSDRPSSFIA